MDYILRSRGAGKTTELIKTSARTGETILCAKAANVLAITEKAERMGLKIPKPISVYEYSSSRVEYPLRKILVDELSAVLGRLLNAEVTAVTDTPTSVQGNPAYIPDTYSPKNKTPIAGCQNVECILETNNVRDANVRLSGDWKLLGVASGNGEFLYSIGRRKRKE